MNRTLWWMSFLLSACVLPDYEVSSSSDTLNTDVSSLNGAPQDCQTCAVQQCAAERTACGANCDGFTWPVAPTWSVSDEADAYVKCLAQQCESQCEVRWGCVHDYTVPESSEPYGVTLTVLDGITSGPLPGVTVRACQSADPTCGSVGRVGSSVSDTSGNVMFTLPQSFFGYFLVEGFDAGEIHYVTTILKPSQPLYRMDSKLEMLLFTQDVLEATATQLETGLEPGRGSLILRALNCMPTRYTRSSSDNALASAAGALASAEQVSFSYVSTTGSRVIYQSPSFTPEPTASATVPGAGGYAFVHNVSPELVSVTATFDNDVVSTTSVAVYPDSIVLVNMIPDAEPF